METIELRNKPELKIRVDQSGFVILDSADPNNSGDYSFSKFNHVKFRQEQTDWFISIISLVVDLITGGGNGGKFKNKPFLQFQLENRNFKLNLVDADLDKAKAITDLLNKKSLHTTTYPMKSNNLLSQI